MIFSQCASTTSCIEGVYTLIQTYNSTLNTERCDRFKTKQDRKTKNEFSIIDPNAIRDGSGDIHGNINIANNNSLQHHRLVCVCV